MTTDNTAHPAPTPAPVAVPEGGWRAHEIVGTQKVSQGVAQTVPEDVVLCVTCGWLRCSEYLTHLLALPRPEPVVAPLPNEAVDAALEASRETPTEVASTSPETWMRNILLAALPHLRLVPEDDEDTVRVPCGCWSCASKRHDPFGLPESNSRMIVCPKCGNKRCPRATHHDHGCTGSNEPNQAGSRFEFADTDDRTNP